MIAFFFFGLTWFRLFGHGMAWHGMAWRGGAWGSMGQHDIVRLFLWWDEKCIHEFLWVFWCALGVRMVWWGGGRDVG